MNRTEPGRSQLRMIPSRCHQLGLAAALIVFCCSLSAVAATPKEFVLDASKLNPKPARVNLAGSFNGWNRDVTPLAAPTADAPDLWRVTVQLPDGVHYYKFIADGDRWINDPASDKDLEVSDGHGGVNSAVLIGFDARKLPTPQPNAVETALIQHNPADIRDANLSDGQLRVRVRLQSGSVDSVSLMAQWQGGNGGEAGTPQSVPLSRVSSRVGVDEFLGSMVVNADAKSVQYWIALKDGTDSKFIGKGWSSGGGQLIADASDGTGLSIQPSAFVTPDWAKHAVWYQIFPERFRNGDPTNDPGDMWYERRQPWTAKWYTSLKGEVPGDQNFFLGAGNVWQRRYGGDLAGVKQKLPYLRSIGVTAIYFNPIFEAESMHKYDTADFRHVDDNFGQRDVPAEPEMGAPVRPAPAAISPLGNRKLYEIDGTPLPDSYVETDDPATWKWTKSDLIFLDFIAEARKQGFKVVIDGVFNHTGRAHPYFQDVLAKGKNSPYADWFDIIDWGDPANWKPMPNPYDVHGKPGGIRWRAWDGPDGHLPNFKKHPQRGLVDGPYQHIMNITKRWLAPGGDPSRGIDGWRLDVANDIPSGFWIEWRKVVKQTKPDAYISGEIWDWAFPWLGGDQFDAVMNYRFAIAVRDFLVNRQQAIPPSAFARRAEELVHAYPVQGALVMMNLFDSHDTDRFASMIINPDRPYDGQNRLQDGAGDTGYVDRPPTPQERARQKLAVTLQMTFLGAPMTYYGNEAGMFSADDPSNRMPMWWKDLQPYDEPSYQFDEDVYAHHQRATALRATFPALRTGTYRTLLADDSADVFAFERKLGNDVVVVVLNRSNQYRNVTIPGTQLPAGSPAYDFLSSSNTLLTWDEATPTARPVLSLKSSAIPIARTEAALKVSLPPLGSAVISVTPQN